MWLKRDDFKPINCCFLTVTVIKVAVEDILYSDKPRGLVVRVSDY